MTTTVKIEAHCNFETTQVQIIETGNPPTILQDGESKEVVVYDDRAVIVQEILKEALNS